MTPSPRPGTDDGWLELAELVGHAARRLRRGSATLLAPLGLTMAQGRVLRIVADGPRRMADIAARLDVVPRTVTPMVDGLEATGLVRRSTDAGDRRSVLVELTAAGRGALAGLDRARRQSASQVFWDLDEPERAELMALLEKLCQSGGCTSCQVGKGAH